MIHFITKRIVPVYPIQSFFVIYITESIFQAINAPLALNVYVSPSMI